MEVLGASVGAIASGNPRLLRLLRGNGDRHAALGQPQQALRMDRLVLLLRRLRLDLVWVLAVAGIREALQAPLYLRQGVALHRGLPRSGTDATGNTHLRHHTVASIFHVDARLRNYRGEFLPLVELLPVGALSAAFHARGFRYGGG